MSYYEIKIYLDLNHKEKNKRIIQDLIHFKISLTDFPILRKHRLFLISNCLVWTDKYSTNLSLFSKKKDDLKDFFSKKTFFQEKISKKLKKENG